MLLSLENRRKREPKEIPSCLIARLLVVFTRQLEILLTAMENFSVARKSNSDLTPAAKKEGSYTAALTLKNEVIGFTFLGLFVCTVANH